MTESRVLGIDLASRGWRQNGSALLTFRPGPPAAWVACRPGFIAWPDGPLTAAAMAQAIDAHATRHEVGAVGIDGPHGWRAPGERSTPGVGRVAEYEARTPGKTGAFGRSYPRNYLGWTRFSIDVFEALLGTGRAVLVNDPTAGAAPLPRLDPGRYYVLECFPTSTWRLSGLVPLPGHRAGTPDVVAERSEQLRHRLALPVGAATRHHDDLQALVAALPAAALLGGPGAAVPRGVAGTWDPGDDAIPRHWVEGLIWDARPLDPGPAPRTGGPAPVRGPPICSRRSRRPRPVGQLPVGARR